MGSFVRIGSAGAVAGGTSSAVNTRDDAFHRERLGRVDFDARVRHRARQQAAEQHAVGAKILGVLGAARDLGLQIRRREIVTEKRVSHERLPR